MYLIINHFFDLRNNYKYLMTIIGDDKFYIENDNLYFEHENQICKMTEFHTTNLKIIDEYLYYEEIITELQKKRAAIINVNVESFPFLSKYQILEYINMDETFEFITDNNVFKYMGQEYVLTRQFVDNELYRILYPNDY